MLATRELSSQLGHQFLSGMARKQQPKQTRAFPGSSWTEP
jgi:hypothetical protein